MCLKHNLKLHPSKCILYANTANWCGRIITPKGVRFDARRLDGIFNMEQPTSGGHLQQFVCALQWMRTGIPNFAKLTSELHYIVERVYACAGKRAKRAVSKVKLSAVGLSKKHDTAFEECMSALAHQCTLTHRDTSKGLCLCTDASDSVWSAILTQVP